MNSPSTDGGAASGSPAGLIPGGASTGSKRPEAIYGSGGDPSGLPTHYVRARGCRVTCADGRELVDCTMALGAVALGYADPEVAEAVARAAREGNVTGLSPLLEGEVAERLSALIPCAERVRFLKTGAEGVAAAVRIARTHTGRDHVIGCGYFGWLDWASAAAGVPVAVRAGFRHVPFDDVPALEEAIAAAGSALAAVVIEPVIEREPATAWLRAARAACDRVGAVLIFDEVKTGFRFDSGGYQRRTGVTPDLAVFGKALANGYPLVAVVGRARTMAALEETWVSSTLASETTALAAAGAVLDRHERGDVCGVLAERGRALRHAVERAIARAGIDHVRAEGPSEMWLLRFPAEEEAGQFVRHAVAAGALLKRGAYNFASVSHGDAELSVVEDAATVAFARVAEDRT